MAETVEGSCYCGAIRFELRFPTGPASHCHCEDCRRTHGAAFVTWTSVPRKQFRFLRGETGLKRHESHPGVRWGFCSDCGTSFWFESGESPDSVYLTVSSLEGPLDREPERHYSYEEAPEWSRRSTELPRFIGKSDQPWK